MTNKAEIESLLYLLDDPDDFVRNSVLQRFESMTHHQIPLLDEFRSKTKDKTKARKSPARKKAPAKKKKPARKR